MKKKITFQSSLLLIFALIIAYRFTYIIAEKGEKQSLTSFSEGKDGFLNYVLLRPWQNDTMQYWHITKHFNSFKELNYNACQQYGGDGQYLGWFGQDSLDGVQRDTLRRIFTNADTNGLRCLLDRSRISWLCLSQRLIYEVENGSGNISTNYGFVYRNNMNGVYGTDDNRTVLKPKAGINSAGFLCDSIYENLQHTDLYYFHPDSSDIKPWIIKPVMKIDTNDFSPTDTTPVVAIKTINYNGDVIWFDTIRVLNFRDVNNDYDGSYISSFRDVDLKVLGRDTIGGLNYGRPDPGDSIDLCKVDFKVYWFGLVDVWFDKMIVDDTRADELFSTDVTINHDREIRDEVEFFGDTIIFFVGEITSSQAYSTKYVKDKMKFYNPAANPKLQFAISNNINLYSHRNTETRSKLLFDIVQPEMMCLDAHVFQVAGGDKIYLPNNASEYDPRVSESWKVSPSVYNQRLQTYAFGDKDHLVTSYQGTFIYQITKIRNDLRQLSENTKFVVQPHLHSWTKTVGGMFEDGGFREPTNEEIQAQATIAIAQGVQSLNWECYHSEKTDRINLNSSGQANVLYTVLGLRNEDSTKRTLNIMHQNKWEYVKALNLKILHWKPYLDKIKWINGYSVHYEGSNHNFITDIKSIIVHSSPPTSCADNINYDCPEESYWEMGFFNPDFDNSSVDDNDKSKYFIMVNRRCFPEINNNGDLRQLKLKFNSSQLSGFKNWKIIELDSNRVIRTFDKDSNIYIDMKIYQPGEGKLYKLAPVIQEGGTLVNNEDCGGFEFNCHGEVNNNGKNINIKPGTTINFSNSSARIIMNEGIFKSGISESENSAPVYLRGENSLWKGLFLNELSDVEISRTYFQDISNYEEDSSYALEMIDCEYINLNSSSFTSDPANQTCGVLINYTSELRAKEAYIFQNFLNWMRVTCLLFQSQLQDM